MDLYIYSDDEGFPWFAFVWGEADPASVASQITPKAIEDQTGFDHLSLRNHCDWPPKVQTYYLRPGDDEECTADFDEMWFFCEEDDPRGRKATGHKFNPQH